MTDDDHEPRDEISLGRDRPRRDVLDRLGAARDAVRRRLGRWFTPVLVVAATVIAIAAAIVTLGIGTGPDTSAAAPGGGGGTAPDSAGLVAGRPVPEADTAAGLGVGDPPQLPYFAGGSLHVASGAAHLSSPPRAIVTRAGVSVALLTDRAVTVLGSPAPIARRVVSGPVLSPDGGLAAWITSRAGRPTVVAWDVGAGTERGAAPVPRGPGAHHPRVVGIDAQGRVYVSVAGRAYLWRPATRQVVPVLLTAPALAGARLDDVTPAGPVFALRSPRGPAGALAYGVVDDRGRLDVTGRTDAGPTVWSPDGTLLARRAGATAVVVEPAAGTPDGIGATTLRTPSVMTIADITWEDDRAVLVVAVDRHGHGAWLRCQAECGSCEIAANLGYTGAGRLGWVVATDAPPR